MCFWCTELSRCRLETSQAQLHATAEELETKKRECDVHKSKVEEAASMLSAAREDSAALKQQLQFADTEQKRLNEVLPRAFLSLLFSRVRLSLPRACFSFSPCVLHCLLHVARWYVSLTCAPLFIPCISIGKSGDTE